jgi:TetR/AcrR family transcriptional regulator, tetracycline repressor protein
MLKLRMTKLRRSEVVAVGLDLLNEVGLDGLTTRRLAERLGVESPTLYWHFRDKAALLNEMASFVVAKHHNATVPEDPQRWREWFADNARAFRRTLMAYRDGARLHAGSKPDAGEIARILPKLDYLSQAGIPRPEALMGLLTAGQFTLGCVMEEQSRPQDIVPTAPGASPVFLQFENDLTEAIQKVHQGGDVAFEFGLNLIADGLEKRIVNNPHRHRGARRRKGA